MRNPIRLKNFKARFLPLYLAGLATLVFLPPSPLSVIWALPLIFVGAVLRGWGAGYLVKNNDLTIGGPYAHLRHPLYAGTLLVSTGFGIALGGWPAVILVLILWPWFALRYFPRKDASESRRLEELYGERFSEYKGAVPALWPRLQAWVGSWNDSSETRVDEGWSLARYSENNELGTLLAILTGVVVFWQRAVAGG
jgi:protein-S-isoprenylcysteine O-methyltransferase Ste14